MKWLIIIALSFIGCKKCAECEITTVTKISGQPSQTATTTTELCGDNLKEQDGNVTTQTSTVNGFTATVTTTTHCK